MSPPAAKPKDARVAGPRSEATNRNYVRVLNPVVWNGSPEAPTRPLGLIKRKVATHYISAGRARWADDRHDQLLLIDSDARNRAAAARAAAGYELGEAIITTYRGITRARQDPGAKTWVVRHDNAATGYAGSSRTVHLRKAGGGL